MYKKQKTFIIAEIGNNHEGNFLLAKKLIREAKKCGADAVKFQTFVPELFVSSKDKKRFLQLSKFQLTYNQFHKLAQYAKKIGIIFFSTPMDVVSAKFLNKIQNIFKISSADNDFYKLIKTVAKFNKTIIVSTGLTTLSEIKKVEKIIFGIWNKFKKNKNRRLVLMHCVSSYPVPPNQANLNAIKTLANRFKNCLVGYSDHTIGNIAALSAVALGAKFIEKHFTIDKNFSNFRDHMLSADPNEMYKLVNDIRELENLLGNGKKNIQKSEKKNLINLRRKAAVLTKISKGKKIEDQDIKWIRSKSGIKNMHENKIIGKRINKNLGKDKIILKNYLY